ncbi:VIT1/CCC1 transporter family protein [Brevirhabdus sp.]|uniref:VIT1/CCC1 transporter family protein n=1 Tax=Brevirhabdus sp. TaxID=2004514 RepID=UPI0040585A20
MSEQHYVSRTGWLRAAVLGANDGLLSTSSILVGVAAAASSQGQILLAGLAGLSAGALSMAAGEYVSVSSQADSEAADLERETRALSADPEGELNELVELLEGRGMSPETARLAARDMTEHDALAAHAREELGLSDHLSANPLQAAIASATAFLAGGALPLILAMILPHGAISYGIFALTLVLLFVLGAVGARAGGAPMGRAALRVAFWGVIAMGATYVIGAVFGTRL